MSIDRDAFDVNQAYKMLPICASCKKIRDDKGYWTQIESYLAKHSEVLFSHGMYPECAEKAMKQIEEYNKKSGL